MNGEDLGGRPATANPPSEDAAHYTGTVAELNGVEVGDEAVDHIIEAAMERLNPANRPVVTATYVTSHIKRRRRSRAEIAALRDGIEAIVAADYPMSVRQVYYRGVVAGLWEKTETEYQCTVARLLLEMRRSGQLPYAWLADNTRWMRKPKSYSSLSISSADISRLTVATVGRQRGLCRNLVRERSTGRRPVRCGRGVRCPFDGLQGVRVRELPVLRSRCDHRSTVRAWLRTTRRHLLFRRLRSQRSPYQQEHRVPDCGGCAVICSTASIMNN